MELPEDNLADLKRLKPLHHLRELSLRGAVLKSLRPLTTLHRLTSLTLEGAQFASIAPVSKISSLKRLFLGTPNAFDHKEIETLRRRRPDLKIY